jgi:hypothetical protein
VTLSFIPLSIAVVINLRTRNIDMYHQVKCKILTVFPIFIIFKLVRLYLFADFMFLKLAFKSPTILAVLPFYTSEIIISIA